MPGFRNWADVTDAASGNGLNVYSWRKTPTQATAAGIWFDLSMSPGNPVPNYYASAPNVFARLGAADGGLKHGSPVAPAQKYLYQLTGYTATAAAVPLPMMLLDYLGYYPFLDMSVAGGEFQPMGNTTGINRYQTSGGQIMAVEVAAQIGGAQFFVTYTNQNGVAGRVTGTVTCNTQVSTGTIINSAQTGADALGPFMALQADDTSARSIDGITFLGGGDVGLVTLVLVRPTADLALRGIDAVCERNYFLDFASMPPIDDDAFLGFICCPNGTLAGAPFHGLIKTTFK